MKMKKVSTLLAVIIGVFLISGIISTIAVQANYASTYWMGNYNGEVESGNLNPFSRDRARGIIQPCGSLLSSGTVTNEAKMVTYLKYFDSNENICTSSPYTATFSKTAIKISNRFATSWYTAPSVHEDVYALAAEIYFTGYCYDHNASLEDNGYYIE